MNNQNQRSGNHYISRRLYEASYFSRIKELERIKKLDPEEFERFIGSLFERMGFNVDLTPRSGDRGIDLFLEKDGEQAIVQCKRFENQVGQPVVRDLYGAMMDCKVYRGYLVTTGTFSMPATAWAQDKSITLVDGVQICDWIQFLTPPPPPLPQMPPPPPEYYQVSMASRIFHHPVPVILAFLALVTLVLVGLDRLLTWLLH